MSKFLIETIRLFPLINTLITEKEISPQVVKPLCASWEGAKRHPSLFGAILSLCRKRLASVRWNNPYVDDSDWCAGSGFYLTSHDPRRHARSTAIITCILGVRESAEWYRKLLEIQKILEPGWWPLWTLNFIALFSLYRQLPHYHHYNHSRQVSRSRCMSRDIACRGTRK